jgi:hypothetical protein
MAIAAEPTLGVGFMRLKSDTFSGNRVFKINTVFSSVSPVLQ